MFLSFRFSNTEMQYGTINREVLAIVICLVEIKWLVISSKYPVKLYTDHQALQSILSKGTDVSS